MKSMFTAIGSGVKGVIEKPIEGSKKGGIGGFFTVSHLLLK
jgi:hypothetical protein